MKNRDLEKLINVMNDPRTINYEDNKDFNINEINNLAEKYSNSAILVIIPNTKGITSEMIERLHNNVYIRITGAYDETRIIAQKGITFVDKKTKYRKSAVDFYYSTVIYTKEETYNILKEIENIESKIKSNWSDIQKLIYLYTALKMKITYDPSYEERSDEEVRSLRGLLTKKTVCAGYSLMLTEFLDRQNIKSYYVTGASKTNHAWNIVEIEGKLYPIDLTFENKNFRLGMQDSYMYLGQSPNRFNSTHEPSKSDPNRALHSRLCKIDRNSLKTIAATVTKEEEFEKIRFICKKENKQDFILIQIGIKRINNEIYYKYYYDTLNGNQLSNKPLILVSKENISKFVDNKNFQKENTITDSSIINELFSKENIEDSRNKKSLYVGELVSYQGTKGFINQLKKEEKDLKLFVESPKVFPRSDGSVLVLEKDGLDPILLGEAQTYKYNAYDIRYVDEKPVLRKRILYSDTDIIYSTREEIQNKLLSEENINYAIENNCGYIGCLNEVGGVIYNNELIRYFNSTEGLTLKSLEKAKGR